ncbi:MAG: hypothetical protein WD002_12530 [Pseudomonadales bacterium]
MQLTYLSALCLVVASTFASAADVGQVRLPNSGAVDAQEDFQHGLAQLHNFEYDSAAEDFRRAQAIDSDFALAYWGEAMTYNHPIWMQQDRAAGRAALQKLADTHEARLAMAETALERDFLRAVHILYGEGDKNARDFLYRDHMAMMHEKYPENPDVGAFYALALMGTAHAGRDFSIYMKAAAVATELFAVFPEHPGLAHYLIHSTDDPIHAPLGYKAAQTYAKIAPNAAHAQHMTSHIFLALGDWQATASANDKAVEVVNRQRAEHALPGIGCGHYPSWQMYAYLQQERFAEAAERMKLCYTRTLDSGGSDQSLAAFYYMKELYLFDTQDWEGDVASLDVNQRGSEAVEFSRSYLNAARALHSNAADVRPVTTEAIDAGERLVRSLNQGQESRDADAGTRSQVKVLHLKAWLADNEGDARQAEKYWRKAVALEGDLPFGFGPPNPAKPALEALGESLLTQRRYAEAVDVFRQALDRTPNRTRATRGLSKAINAVQNDTKENGSR